MQKKIGQEGAFSWEEDSSISSIAFVISSAQSPQSENNTHKAQKAVPIGLDSSFELVLPSQRD